MRWVMGTALAVLASGCGGGTGTYAALLSVEPVEASAHEVLVTGLHGACDEVLPAQVTETAREVRVQVPLRRTGEPCRDVGVSLSLRLELDQPLGERTVVDASTGDEVPVTGRSAPAVTPTVPAAGAPGSGGVVEVTFLVSGAEQQDAVAAGCGLADGRPAPSPARASGVRWYDEPAQVDAALACLDAHAQVQRVLLPL